MAVFATAEEMESALGKGVLDLIADDDKDGRWDRPVVETGLAAASSIAETYINAFLPLPYTPDSLKQATFALANELIRRRRDLSTDDSKLAFKDAMDWLKDISKGNAVLIPQVAPDATEPGDPEMVAQPRRWSRDSARGGF